MTEALGETYETEKLEVSPETLEAVESFTTAINNAKR
jgi:hypothetical protein